MSKFRIDDPANILGAEVEDIITGFKGIAISKVIHITGCIQYYVKPRVEKDGKYPEGGYFDEARCLIIGPGIKETGGETPRAQGGETLPPCEGVRG